MIMNVIIIIFPVGYAFVFLLYSQRVAGDDW